jgi:hypothetical protein
MPVAAKIRKALHHHGIHSSTIQPEYHHPDIQSKVRQFVISRHFFGHNVMFRRTRILPALSFALWTRHAILLKTHVAVSDPILSQSCGN